MDQNEIQNAINAYNQAGIADFDGLSAEVMQQIIYAPKESDFFHLNTTLNEHDYAAIPLLALSESYLQILNTEGEIKLTKIENLPVKYVKALYEQKIFPNPHIDEGLWTLRNEGEFQQLVLVRSLHKLAKTTKTQKGKQSLTQKGKELLGNKAAHLHLLLDTFSFEFNFGYFDRYPDNGTGQMALIFSLYLLQKYGATQRNVSFYSKKYFQAFPMLTEEFKYSAFDLSHSCYTLRVFERYLSYLGVIQYKRDTSKKAATVKKSPLFEKIFKIALSPQKKFYN